MVYNGNLMSMLKKRLTLMRRRFVKGFLSGFRLYRHFRALMKGQRVFWVPSLKRVCFAKNTEQCQSKFMKHSVERHGIISFFAYIFFNKYV